ncbi:hypothetical protein MANES_15G010950v8 [Manihot esculenta]|uniref:Uncharacterized protein n=1 Tax=Manihot esculenta TaxID=3983 RepID=A0ACB7GA15_MANES|nr:hypothetical protein MANES_15G010950v8 [Manihot esculenta]
MPRSIFETCTCLIKLLYFLNSAFWCRESISEASTCLIDLLYFLNSAFWYRDLFPRPTPASLVFFILSTQLLVLRVYFRGRHLPH